MLVDRVVDVVLHMEVVLEDTKQTREHCYPKNLGFLWIIHPHILWHFFLGPAKHE
jgi:hypothetical protein